MGIGPSVPQSSLCLAISNPRPGTVITQKIKPLNSQAQEKDWGGYVQLCVRKGDSEIKAGDHQRLVRRETTAAHVTVADLPGQRTVRYHIVNRPTFIGGGSEPELNGYNVLSIRAKHKQKEREVTVREFNDTRSHVQVLVNNAKFSAISINLQKDCSDAISIDVPSNAQATLQAGARVVRIGQTRSCSIYIVTLDHSYGQYLQALAARKMHGIIASYTSRRFSDDERHCRHHGLPSERTEYFQDLKYSIMEYAKDFMHVNDVRGHSSTRKSIVGYWNQLIWRFYAEFDA